MVYAENFGDLGRGVTMFTQDNIAIELENNSIKLLVGNSSAVKLSEVLALPENFYLENKVIDAKVLAAMLLSFIAERGIKTKKLMVLVQGQDIVTRYIEVPVMEEKGIRNAVLMETSQFLPNKGESHYVDYEILDKITSDSKKVYKVMVAAVPREKVDSYQEAAELANLELKVVDTANNSLARLFGAVQKKNAMFEEKGIIYMENTSSSLCIVKGGKLLMEREVPFGKINLIREVVKQEGTSNLEAEQWLNNSFSFEAEGEEELKRRIIQLMDNVLSSFEKVIQFYNQGKTEKSLNSMYILGCGSTIPGLASYVQKYFNTTTAKIMDLRELSIKLSVPKDMNFDSFAPLLGLLLRRE